MQRHLNRPTRSTAKTATASRAGDWLILTALSLAIFAMASAMAQADCKEEPGPGIDWSECQKTRLMISGRDLSGGTFELTFFTSTDLRNADLSGANLVRAEFSNASLAGAELPGANLEKAAGLRTDFSGANLADARLYGAEFSRANFKRATLTGVDFGASEMNRSDFTEADLTGANMAKAELARVTVTDAVISGVSFSFSNISRADFRGVDLDDADLTGTYMFLTQLGGADLSRTKGLTAGQLEIACGSGSTLLPAGLSAPDSWPCPDYAAE